MEREYEKEPQEEDFEYYVSPSGELEIIPKRVLRVFVDDSNGHYKYYIDTFAAKYLGMSVKNSIKVDNYIIIEISKKDLEELKRIFRIRYAKLYLKNDELINEYLINKYNDIYNDNLNLKNVESYIKKNMFTDIDDYEDDKNHDEKEELNNLKNFSSELSDYDDDKTQQEVENLKKISSELPNYDEKEALSNFEKISKELPNKYVTKNHDEKEALNNLKKFLSELSKYDDDKNINKIIK